MSVLNRYSYLEEFRPSPSDGGGEQSSSPPAGGGGLKQMFEENRRRHLMTSSKQPEINRHLPRTNLSRENRAEVPSNVDRQDRARSIARDSVVYSPSVPPPPPPPPPAPVLTSNTKSYDQNVVDPGVLIAQAIAERLKNADNNPNNLAMKQRKTTPLAQVQTPMTFMEELHRALLKKRQSSDMSTGGNEVENIVSPEIRVQPSAESSRSEILAQPAGVAEPSRFLPEAARKKFEEASNEFEAKSVAELFPENEIKPVEIDRLNFKEPVRTRENDQLREPFLNSNTTAEDNYSNMHSIVERVKSNSERESNIIDDVSESGALIQPMEAKTNPLVTQSAHPLVSNNMAAEEDDELSKYLKSIHTSFVAEVNEPNAVPQDRIESQLSNFANVSKDVPDANEVVKVMSVDTYFSSYPLKQVGGESNILEQFGDVTSNGFMHKGDGSSILEQTGGVTSNGFMHRSGTANTLEQSGDASSVLVRTNGTSIVLVDNGVTSNSLVHKGNASNVPDAHEVVKVVSEDTYFSSNPLKQTSVTSNILEQTGGVTSNDFMHKGVTSNDFMHKGDTSNVAEQSGNGSNILVSNNGTSIVLVGNGVPSNGFIHNGNTSNISEHVGASSNSAHNADTVHVMAHNEDASSLLMRNNGASNILVADSIRRDSLKDPGAATVLEVNKVSSDVLKTSNVPNYSTFEANDSRNALRLEASNETRNAVRASMVTTNEHDVSTENEEERVLKLLDLACADSSEHVSSGYTLNGNVGGPINGWVETTPLSYNGTKDVGQIVGIGPTFQTSMLHSERPNANFAHIDANNYLQRPTMLEGAVSQKPPLTFVNVYPPQQRSDVNSTPRHALEIESSRSIDKAAQPMKQKRFDTPIFRPPPNTSQIDHPMPSFVNSAYTNSAQATGNTIRLTSNRFIKNGSNRLKDGHLERSIDDKVNNHRLDATRQLNDFGSPIVPDRNQEHYRSKVNEGTGSTYHRRKKALARRMENETKYSERTRKNIYNKIESEMPVLYDENQQIYLHPEVEMRRKIQKAASQPAANNLIENRKNREAVYSKLAMSSTEEHFTPIYSPLNVTATDIQMDNPKRLSNNPSGALGRMFKSAKDAIKSWRRDSRISKHEQFGGPHDIYARGPLEGSFGEEFQTNVKMIRGHSDRYHPVARPRSMNGLLQTRSLTRLSQHYNRNSFGSTPGLNMPSTPNFALYRPTMSPFPHDPCRDASPGGFSQGEVKYALNGGCINTLQSFNPQPTAPAIFQKLLQMSHATDKYVDSPNFVLESLAPPVNVSGGYSSVPNSPRLFTVTGASPTQAGFRSAGMDSNWHSTPVTASATSGNWHSTPTAGALVTEVSNANGYDTRM